MNWAIFVLSASLFVLPAPTLAKASEEPDWSSFAGSWRGKGMLGDGPTGALERGVCKFDIKSDNNGLTLIIKGRCASSARSVAVATTVKAKLSSNQISATTRSRALPGQVTSIGTASPRRIDLSSVQPVKLEEGNYGIATQISVSGDTMTMVQTLLDTQTGQKSEQMRMKFEKLR